MQQRVPLGGSGVAVISLAMFLFSSLILYPEVTNENILTALQVTSVTTALPFLLVFTAKPLTLFSLSRNLGQWSQTNRSSLWLILTISHFLHLYQIWLYYQQGQSCPWYIWAITAPLWLIMALFSGVELVNPYLFDRLSRAHGNRGLKIAHGVGSLYIWLVFTLAFGVGTLEHHLLFYNAPALVLFLAGALSWPMMWLLRRAIV